MRVVSFILLLLTARLYSQNYNTELLSNVRFNDDCANIWGYADSAGREYAIIGRVTGTSIFDVTDGKNPKLLKHITGAISSWREIKSWKNRIYVVADRGADGMLIINMSKAPQEITSLFWKPIVSINDKTLNINKSGTIDRSHDLFIDEKGFCYLTGSNFHSGTVILDLNKNPDNPELKGIFNPNYTHDSYARNDTFWSADIINGEFTVWDVKDKASAKKLASQKTGNTFTHNIWLSDDGKYAFTTDERANAFVEAYSVSNLQNITLVDKYRSRTTQIRNTIPHNTFYHKGYLTTSYYTDGFTIVDASDPTHLVEVGAYDTYPGGEGDFHGCWGVYPYLPSGNILASDIEFGLYVVKPTYIKASYLKGIISDSASSSPLADAIIKINKASNLEVNSRVDGSYKSGGPYIGDVLVTVSKPGYITKTVSAQFKQGAITELNVKLQPQKKYTLQVKTIDAISKLPIMAFVRLNAPNETINMNTTIDGSASAIISEGNWELTSGAWGWKYTNKLINITGNSTTPLIIELKSGYEDHFITDYGWTAASTAIGGIWGRAEPVGAYQRDKTINPEMDLDTDYGNLCMITGNGSSAPTGGDVDNGYTRLYSPVLDISKMTKPVLNFYAWTVRQNFIEGLLSFGSHRVYIVSGRDTILIDSLIPNKPEWTKYSLSINTKNLTVLDKVYFMFEAFEPSGIDARNIIEFGIDGFFMSDQNTTAIKNDEKIKTSIHIQPNPVDKILNISTEAQNHNRKISIYDISGKIVATHTLPKNISNISFDTYIPAGTYFLSLTGLTSEKTVTRFIKM